VKLCTGTFRSCGIRTDGTSLLSLSLLQCGCPSPSMSILTFRFVQARLPVGARVRSSHTLLALGWPAHRMWCDINAAHSHTDDNGALGSGSSTLPSSALPLSVTGLSTPAVSISCGRHFSCAIVGSPTSARCWGQGTRSLLRSSSLCVTFNSAALTLALTRSRIARPAWGWCRSRLGVGSGSLPRSVGRCAADQHRSEPRVRH
jgi:hypothetical protein